MPLGVLIIGEVKRLIREAEGNRQVRSRKTRDGVCSPVVNGGRPEAYRSIPGQFEARESWVEEQAGADLPNRSEELGIGVVNRDGQ